MSRNITNRSSSIHKSVPPPSKRATLAQFRVWPPGRQRLWIKMMNTEKARNALNPDQIQNLTQAQVIFDRGL